MPYTVTSFSSFLAGVPWKIGNGTSLRDREIVAEWMVGHYKVSDDFRKAREGKSVISSGLSRVFLKICTAMITAVAQVAQKLAIRWYRGDRS